MVIAYNNSGLNDILMCMINKNIDNVQITEKKIDNLVVLTQGEKIIGVNILNASQTGLSLPKGLALAPADDEIAEIENYINQKASLELSGNLQQQFTIGYVETSEPHPDSNKLSVCTVNVGNEVLQIVCGAQNVKQDIFVVVSLCGCIMPSGIVIESANLRNVSSNGMICSAKELNLPEQYHTPGIMILPNTVKVGTAFFKYFYEEMNANE